MAHFAKVDKNLNLVVDVIVLGSQVMLDENGNEVEQRGIDYLNNNFTDEYWWIQTSYNTKLGKHLKGGIPLRKNYAGIGFSWDSTIDAFIPPKPSETAVLNLDTCIWEIPETQIAQEIQSEQIRLQEIPHN